MNLSQVRKLEEKDTVVFQGFPFQFTKGKAYRTKKTGIGTWVESDTGRWFPLAGNIEMEMYFEPQEG